MPENNFCLLRVNIRHVYREKHVWSKCGRKHGFVAIDHSLKMLSHSRLHHICGRVVEIFRKIKFYGFQVYVPCRPSEMIAVSIPTSRQKSRHLEDWQILSHVPMGQTKRQYGRTTTKDNSTKAMAMAMTTHDADWKMNAANGS